MSDMGLVMDLLLVSLELSCMLLHHVGGSHQDLADIVRVLGDERGGNEKGKLKRGVSRTSELIRGPVGLTCAPFLPDNGFPCWHLAAARVIRNIE